MCRHPHTPTLMLTRTSCPPLGADCQLDCVKALERPVHTHNKMYTNTYTPILAGCKHDFRRARRARIFFQPRVPLAINIAQFQRWSNTLCMAASQIASRSVLTLAVWVKWCGQSESDNDSFYLWIFFFRSIAWWKIEKWKYQGYANGLVKISWRVSLFAEVISKSDPSSWDDFKVTWE